MSRTVVGPKHAAPSDTGGHQRVVPQWTLGDRLRKARRHVGASQAAFAEQLGSNQKTYAAWELDLTAPRNVIAVARKVESVSGIPAAWILGVDSPIDESDIPTNRG